MKSQDILGKKLLFITAHPDDESYLAAGTIYKNWQFGGENTIICATFGEKGKFHLPQKIKAGMLKKIRKQELEKVSKFLGVSRLYELGLADGNLKINKNKLAGGCKGILKIHKPNYIIGFGPDGITGHWDHITAYEVAKSLASFYKLPYLSFALSPKISKNAMDWLKLRRKNDCYCQEVHFSKPNLRMKINGKIKKSALLLHKSQLDDGKPFKHYPKKAQEEFLKYEYFGYT